MRKVVFEESTSGITIDRIIRDYEYTMPTRHVHDEYEIYYLVEGERYYFIEQQTYHVKKGSLVIVNRGQIHKTGSVDNKSYHDRILIEFRREPVASLFSSVGELDIDDFFARNHGVIELDEDNQKYVESLLTAICEETKNKNTGYQLVTAMRLADLIICALRCKKVYREYVPNITLTTAKHQKVDEVAAYIIDNCTRPISLDCIAKSFYVSKCYLSRIFREVTGFTVNEYINVHRMKAAQQLLLESSMTITEIADALGYESITYFEKVFKKYRETSPLKYRKQYRKREQPAREKKEELSLP